MYISNSSLQSETYEKFIVNAISSHLARTLFNRSGKDVHWDPITERAGSMIARKTWKAPGRLFDCYRNKVRRREADFTQTSLCFPKSIENVHKPVIVIHSKPTYSRCAKIRCSSQWYHECLGQLQILLWNDEVLIQGQQNEFDLVESERATVDELEERQTLPSVLVLPRYFGEYTVDTDASDSQLGCVLMQDHDDKWLKPVGYSSRSLCNAEQNYDLTR